MLRSFRNKGLCRFVETGDRGKVSVQNIRRLEQIMRALHVAERPEDMDVPGWRFHPLKGNMTGRYSVTVSGNWRVTFGWNATDAVEIDLEDYH